MALQGRGAATGFHGILAYLRDNAEDARSDSYREYMMSYMSAVPARFAAASACAGVAGRQGRRLSIADFTAFAQSRTFGAINLQFTEREALVAERFAGRLPSGWNFFAPLASATFRSTACDHLSGGEGQRIRLATQIGSRLRAFVRARRALHRSAPADNNRLIEALEKLRDLATRFSWSSTTRNHQACRLCS